MKQLAVQAKEHGRSMEAEVRDILTRAAQDIGGVDGLVLPERTDTARAVDFE